MPAAGAAAAVFAAGAFLVVPPVTPLLMVLMTVLLAAGAAAGAALDAAAVLLFTTVAVLPSLDSLVPLTLRPARDAAAALLAAAVAVVAAPLLVLVTGGAAPLEELAVEDVVVFRAVAAARVDRAFSTMLLNILVDGPALVGDTGLAMSDLPGEAPARALGTTRELEVVGERTWPGLPLMAAPPRSRFLGLSIFSVSFSLSPNTSSLMWHVSISLGILVGNGNEPQTLERAARGCMWSVVNRYPM